MNYQLKVYQNGVWVNLDPSNATNLIPSINNGAVNPQGRFGTVGDYSIAFGYATQATKTQTIAIGQTAFAQGDSSIALGGESNAYAGYTIAIGHNASCTGFLNSIALGRDSHSYGTNAISMGTGSVANAIGAISLGGGSISNDFHSISVGTNSNSKGYASVSMGLNSATSLERAIALGSDAKSTSLATIAIGYKSVANDINAIAIGRDALSYNINAIAIGTNALTRGTNAIAIGGNAYTGSYILSNTTSVSDKAIAIGYFAGAENNRAMAIGYLSRCRGGYAVAVGQSSEADGEDSGAFGSSTWAQGERSTALGYMAVATQANSIKLGDENVTVYTQRSVQTTSDVNDKTDFKPIEDSLEFISKIDTIRYVSNPRDKYIERVDGNAKFDKEAHKQGTLKSDRYQVGVKAQQVYELAKEMYGTDNYAQIVNINDYDKYKDDINNDNARLTVSYENFIPFLIESIKDLKSQVDDLKEQLKNK